MFDTHIYKKAAKMREKIIRELAGFKSHKSSNSGGINSNDVSMTQQPLNLLEAN